MLHSKNLRLLSNLSTMKSVIETGTYEYRFRVQFNGGMRIRSPFTETILRVYSLIINTRVLLIGPAINVMKLS